MMMKWNLDAGVGSSPDRPQEASDVLRQVRPHGTKSPGLKNRRTPQTTEHCVNLGLSRYHEAWDWEICG